MAKVKGQYNGIQTDLHRATGISLVTIRRALNGDTSTKKRAEVVILAKELIREREAKLA